MRMLNLGCGTKTSDREGVINIDWSLYLRVKKRPVLRPLVPLIMKGERLARYRSLPENVMVHDLAKGLPFDSASVDVVYHSHFLEHLGRDEARNFLLEVWRVLRPGGIHRIVVPDFERACRSYLSHISVCEKDPDECRNHDRYIERALEQSVRREAAGTSQQRSLRRLVENVFLGDARRRGETHEWMYDRVSLRAILTDIGSREVVQQDHETSLISGWTRYGLDSDEQGGPYKRESLYMEAMK